MNDPEVKCDILGLALRMRNSPLTNHKPECS